MKLKKGFVKTKLLDNYVIVPTGEAADSPQANSSILKLNETASRIWDYISAGKTTEEICDIMTAEFNVSRDKVKEDIAKVINMMKSMDAFK